MNIIIWFLETHRVLFSLWSTTHCNLPKEWSICPDDIPWYPRFIRQNPWTCISSSASSYYRTSPAESWLSSCSRDIQDGYVCYYPVWLFVLSLFVPSAPVSQPNSSCGTPATHSKTINNNSFSHYYQKVLPACLYAPHLHNYWQTDLYCSDSSWKWRSWVVYSRRWYCLALLAVLV